jgi:hypothetical protein
MELKWLGLALLLAGQVAVSSDSAAQTLPTPSPTTAPTTSPTTAAAKLATTIEVATQNTVRGQNVALVALLLNALGKPMSGQAVTFRVRDPAGTLVKSCAATTDSMGRATCYHQVPYMNAPTGYDVNALYSGNSQYAPAHHTTKLLVSAPAHTGSITKPNGAQVSVGDTEGLAGRYTQLRAYVESNGAPVTSGRVRFWANGKSLTSANVDGSGLARVSVSPTASQLSTFQHDASAKSSFGGLQAWYEPATGSKLLPGLGIGAAYFDDARDSCERLNLVAPTKCSAATATPSKSNQTRLGVFTVYKNGYGSGQVTTKPQLKITFTVPPKPAPNTDCNPNLISIGSSFCDRSCGKLEYYAFDHMGRLQFARANSSATGAQACSWELVTDVTLAKQAYQLAHDQCATVARQQGRTTWNHTATMKVPHWIAAGFKFRDPHVVPIGTPSMLDIAMQNAKWKAVLGWETILRETTANLDVSVNCR